MDSATIVAAALDSSQLEQSINKLVSMVAEKTKAMSKSFTDEVARMEQAVKNLGNVKINSGGTADGGSSRRTSKQKEEENQVKATTQAYKEQRVTLDQQAAAIRKASQVSVRTGDAGSVRNADTLQTMNIQLDLLRERLREARNQYSSFVALASHATTTGDKGLYQFATEGVHKYGDEVRTLIPQIRGLQNAIQQMGDVIAPQGHTIQNYVNTIGKATPELKQLGEQIKTNSASIERGNADMNSATASANRYTEAIQRQAQAIRESEAYKKGERVVLNTLSDGTEIVAYSEKRLSLEQQIINAKQAEEQITKQQAAAEQQVEQQVRLTEEGLNKVYAEQRRVNEEINKRASGGRNGASPFQSYDNLRESIAAVLGLQKEQVASLTTETSSYNALTKQLKQLKQAYDSLSKSDRESSQGRNLVASIHTTERAIQKLQQQMSRPTSFNEAMHITVKTLDDIAYKIRMLQAYKQGIDITKPNAANEIRKVDEALNKLNKDADKWMSKSKSMIEQSNALGRSWNYMKNRLAFYFTVGASTQFIKNLIEVRSQYEMNERALGVLIDSAERGTQIFNELSQMALVSPYTLIELSAAAKQLTAYDVAAKDVVDTTRRLADMAAAVGIPIERLTYALGQIKAYGYLNSRDARMFANAGIPLVKQLSEYYTELEGKLVSTADVYDRIKKKTIDYNEVMEVINKMTDRGGKFFDFQAKMADTLKVRLANLTLAWNNMLNEIGKSQQGVLTWGIGALKELFLQWKNINDTLSNVSWAVGVRTAVMILVYSLLKLGNALGLTTKQMSLNAVFGARLAGVIRTVSSAMWSLVKKPLTWWSLLAVAAVEATQALLGANEAQKALNESIRNGAKDNYNNISKFLEQYKDIRESLYETRKVAIGNIYDPSSRKAAATAYSEESFAKDIDNNEAKKAWEAIREQIELTTSSSDKYIQSLLSISNISERVRQGFAVLEDIKVVNAALKELSDDTIKIEKELSGWWNAYMLPDGLVGNLKDYTKQLGYIEENWGNLENATKRGSTASEDAISDLDRELNQFREDLKVTTDSIINFIELKGWSGDVNKINETFKQITQKIVLDNQLDPQKAFILQSEVEEARSKAAKEALLQRINDEKAALAQTAEEETRKALQESINTNVNEYNNWNEFNGRKKVEWERFTKWLKEQHISETTAMFRNMDAEDIKSLNFQEGKHAEWVNRMVTQYAKEHKMSYDEAFNYLKSWIKSANQWSVFIPLIISTEDKKSIYDQLGEYDKLVDEADAQIERLGKRIEELKAKKELDKKETEELSKAERELADAEKSKRDAESHGGHGKKEKKDAKDAAKAQKAAETELQKALKEELKLIDEVRSQYKKLTDAGVSRAIAMKTVTEQFGDSIKHINAVLGKNGLPKFDIKSFAGTDNPHEMMVMLKKQIDAAKNVKNIKPEEINELEIKYSKIKVDAEAYDATKIKKGLDNELGRLKDEYELAVELDANPELGNMFADMFDIDLDTLPRTAKEYAEMYTKSLNKYFKQMGANIELPNMLNLTRNDMEAFTEQLGTGELQQAYFDLIQKGYEATQAALKKEATDDIREYDKLLQKYAEYQYKLTQIAKEANEERKALVVKFGTDEQKESARKIYAQLEVEDDPQKAEELKKQLKVLVDQVVSDDQVRIQLKVAIDKKEVQESAKASFEEFQKNPIWTTAIGDLEGMTHKALRLLINDLEDFKKANKDLSPKQIKEIERTITKLRKQSRKDNPFYILANAISDAKERAGEFQPRINEIEEEIDRLTTGMDSSNLDENSRKIAELRDELSKLKEIQDEEGGIDWEHFVGGINSALQIAKQATGYFTDMMDALGGKEGSLASKRITEIFGVLEKAGTAAAMGAMIGGGWGAAIGAVIGGLSAAATTWADEWSGNASITRAMNASVKAAKDLENTYKRLTYVSEEFYGATSIASKEAAKNVKILELAELQRQLRLEESRDSKDRDQDKINEIRSLIIDLEHEIANATKKTVSDLLGISSHADFFEGLISDMISAFKNGEDAMEVFENKWAEMIDSMVTKMILGQVLQQWIKSLESGAEGIVGKYTAGYATQIADLESKLESVESMSKHDFLDYIMENEPELYRQFLARYGMTPDSGWQNIMAAWIMGGEELREEYIQMLKNSVDSYTDEQARASLDATSELMDYYEQAGEEFKEKYLDAIVDKISENYTFGEGAESKLSALQQGIQGVTEETAGALEAYMNGVSQQVYYQSEILTQIRDAVVVMDGDVQLGTQAQMLLQLQQSYAVQMAIQTILEGWSSPNGLAVRVEMQ